NQSKGWVTGERGTLFMASLNTGISFISNRIPAHFFLSQNYPNPFNPITKIKFNIAPRLSSPSPSNTFGLGSSGDPLVTLKVYDILGKEVAILVNEKLKPGEYEVSFDGGSLSSGIYFYTLSTDNFKETKKMLLIK
ncbi:MAG: T9SS type A sorting domain-containing protein, partial [Ignavibacteriae bacterium]|nr:T9SS type A sorting domain-containing protein [Ignavibacteriota bacterium]